MKKTLIINKKDNVAIALEPMGDIPRGHKLALCDIPKGTYVIKYGQIIGCATEDIAKGAWVHTHNLRSHLSEESTYTYDFQAEAPTPQSATFWGYRRKNRRAGIRNEIYIIPTVGCVNDVCIRLAKAAEAYKCGSVDGIYALTHQFGCSQLGDDGENFKRLLCGIARNPNASYVLFVGLGCENNRLSDIEKALSDCDHIAFFNCQDVEDEHAYGLAILRDFIQRASALSREELPLSELCLGLKCGGSDAFSGITANPLVGRITDRAIACGASAILTEVPEMFGAEQLLMNKCKNAEIFSRYRSMIEGFKAFYTEAGFPIYENPSPGNKDGGITTLEEKSLGCIEKAGSSAIVDVLAYAEPCTLAGVSVLDAPGNDLIAATALAASGAQLVLFTTGRGTPFSTFVPTLKISTSRALAEKKRAWIDFDASSMDEEGLFTRIIETASGTYTCKSEDVREIAFFKKGVTL